MKKIPEMNYVDDMKIFHDGNYDDMSNMYKKRKVSLQSVFCLPPSPKRIVLSKRNHNYSVDVNNGNDIKSRVSFFPAANTTTNQSLKAKLEMINKFDGKYAKNNSSARKDPKEEIKLAINSPISTIKNMRKFENKNTLKTLTKKYEYRMFLEDHIYENLTTTTIELLKHQEDMGITGNPHRFYKYQRDALDEQKILAEEIRRDYISGRSDPSLKAEMIQL